MRDARPDPSTELRRTDRRRGFLAMVAAVFTTALGAAVALPGLVFLAGAARRRTVTGGDDPIRVASPDDVKPGPPLRVNVIGQRRDGWTRVDHVKLGAAWLLRTPEGRVRAFSTVCPHLGCSVEWNDRAEQFACPCHDSGFARDGRCLHGPSPRGLDELDVIASGTDIHVRYRRFKVAIKEKEPLG